MKIFYPLFANKKKVVMFLVLTAGVLVTFVFLLTQRPGKVELDFGSRKMQLAQIFQTSKDSDNDGLEDWAEALWKTDPSNPDTDGDGMSDGEEVKQDRDPNKPWPGDQRKNDDFKTQNERVLSVETFSEEFLKSILGRKLNEGTLNVNEVSEELAYKVASSPDPVKDLSVEEISFPVTPEQGKEKTKKYLSAVSRIIERHIPKMKSLPGESDILKTYALEEKKDSLEKFSLWQEAYRQLRRDLATVSVPADWASQHREMLQVLWRLEETSRLFAERGSDPIVFVKLVQSSLNAQQRAEDLFRSMVSQRDGSNLSESEATVYLFSFF